MLMQSSRPHWGRRVVRGLLGVFHLVGNARPPRWRFGYERCGIQVWGEPIPWNAESVLVELLGRGIPPRGAAREEYRLDLPMGKSLRPTALEAGQDRAACISFRLSPPGRETAVTIRRGERILQRGVLPFLTEQEFLGGLRLESPLLVAQVGRHLTPCRAVVAAQCRRLQACGLLTSPTALLPLAGQSISLEFARGSESRTFRFLPRLTGSQLAGGRALLALPPIRCPQGVGTWSVRWSAAGQTLACTSLRTLSRRDFCRSLYLVDAGFRTEGWGGVLHRPYLTTLEGLTRVGAHFRVASREEGAAGACRLEVRTRVRPSAPAVASLRVQVLVAGAPAAVLPPPLLPQAFQEVESFELCCAGRGLGTLEGGIRRPTVRFNAEGGYYGTEEFGWTAAAEQELADRLGRLFVPETDEPVKDESDL